MVLFFDHSSDEDKTIYGNLGYLFLDKTLGEYDVETKLGFIDFQNKTLERFDSAKQLKYLAIQVDEYFENKH